MNTHLPIEVRPAERNVEARHPYRIRAVRQGLEPAPPVAAYLCRIRRVQEVHRVDARGCLQHLPVGSLEVLAPGPHEPTEVAHHYPILYGGGAEFHHGSVGWIETRGLKVNDDEGGHCHAALRRPI